MMRGFFRSIVCGALAALIVGGGALAVGAGGFPSRPFLQALGVGETAPASGGVAIAKPASGATLTADRFKIYDNAKLPAGLISDVGLATGQGSPTRGKLYIGDGSGWNFYISARNTSGVDTDLVQFNDTGPVNYLVGPIEHAGQPVILNAYFNGSGTGCPIVRSTGISGCTRNATGIYTFTFSQTLAQTPVCVANVTGVVTALAYVDQEGTTSARVVLSTTGGAATDAAVKVICE